MRKLREAAIVAAMVGSVSMFGAGIVSAHEPELPTVACEQNANTALTESSTDAESGDVASGGDANSSADQQVCGLGNDDNTNTSGTATGGEAGGDGAIDIGLLDGVLGA